MQKKRENFEKDKAGKQTRTIWEFQSGNSNLRMSWAALCLYSLCLFLLRQQAYPLRCCVVVVSLEKGEKRGAQAKTTDYLDTEENMLPSKNRVLDRMILHASLAQVQAYRYV